MTKEEFLSLLDRYLAGNCTAEEQAYFDRFYSSFQRSNEHWENWALAEREHIRLKLYEAITRQMEKEEPVNERVQKKRPRFSYVRAAASVALLAAVGWMGYKMIQFSPEVEVKYITQATARGQRSTLTLSDGSVVRLNVASTLSFPEQFQDGRREVTLEGEAFFDVKPDPERPFIVHSGKLKTTVLGTSFNIRAYPFDRALEVTVKTGKVNVAGADDPAGHLSANSHTLIPGEQLHYNNDTDAWQKRKALMEKDLAWTQNILYLDDTPLRDVVELLEKWYDMRIVMENDALGDCLISGKYKSDRLTNILDGLSFMQGISYRFAGNRNVILTGKPCKQSLPMP